MESCSCIICKKSFSSNSALRKHYRLKHPGMEQPSKRRGRPIKNVIRVIKKNAKCSQCSKAFGSSTAAKVHETIVHGRKNTLLLYFPNVDGFMAWKREEEDKTMCRFVKVRASQKKKDFERRYYVCHRSGHFVSKSKQIRHLKLQGSCKTGQECTSFVKVKINASEFVTVNYCPVHTGHTAQMAHLTMRLEDRQELARYIDEGVPFDEILDKIKMTCSNERISYIWKQDLHNIAKEFGLSKSLCFHKSDAVQTPLERDGIAHPNARPEVTIEDHVAQLQMETDAILTCFGGHSSEIKQKQKTGFCDILRFLLSSFENEEDPETITECFERAKKLKSFYLATKKSNSTSLIPSSKAKEQANKKVETQRTFNLSSREPICTKPLGKPTSTKKYILMNSLDGTIQYTGAERLHDHNYASKS